jgi:hypothetical protein
MNLLISSKTQKCKEFSKKSERESSFRILEYSFGTIRKLGVMYTKHFMPFWIYVHLQNDFQADDVYKGLSPHQCQPGETAQGCCIELMAAIDRIMQNSG